ncbi:hypothetical protein BDV10DRAFT_190219 [Aspergillus recurvatus]
MSDRTQPPPPTPAGKRSACDRCRTQKLGCIRVDPTDACLRCVRSQAECVTSSSRRPGRPVRAAAAPPPVDLPGPVPVDPDVDVDVDMSATVPVNVDEALDFAALDIPYDLPLTFFTSIDSAPFSSHDYFPNGLDYNDVDSGLGDRSPSTLLLDHRSSLSTPSTPSPPHKHHQSLLRLHQKLSKQLTLVQSTQYDLAEVLRVTCIHHNTPPSPDHLLKTTPEPHTTHRTSTSPPPSLFSPNPLATMTTHAAEFLSLLHTLQTLKTTTPDLLTALSCYILLISTYDTLLAHTLAHPAALDHAAPVLALGGLPVRFAPSLPAHLLLSLLNSQLQPIEACLGLPEVLRVCEGGRSPGHGQSHTQSAGLFGRPGGQALCMALVQVEREQERGECSMGGAGAGVLGVVAALRGKRRRVLGL